jgi:hypothetical protein
MSKPTDVPPTVADYVESMVEWLEHTAKLLEEEREEARACLEPSELEEVDRDEKHLFVMVLDSAMRKRVNSLRRGADFLREVILPIVSKPPG